MRKNISLLTLMVCLFSVKINAQFRAALLVWLLCFVAPSLYAQTQFITKWDLSITGTSTTALTFGVQVAAAGAATYTWNTVPAGTSGSGTIAANATSVTISGLPANAIIEVKINPTNFQRININNGADKLRLLEVSQWGTTTWTSMANAFHGCLGLNITATDVPILTTVTDMSSMFRNCRDFNSPSNIGTWNTAAVTNMSRMFNGALDFNQNIGTWNTANVTDMSFMFQIAIAFNQNIGTWNTTKAKNMSFMFQGAFAFNQNIGTWNVAAVTDMSFMFAGATDLNNNNNATIGNWNTTAVTNMTEMFFNARAFNQNIGTWNVAAVTDMSFMFQGATAFNQSLAAWGTKFNAAVNLTSCLNNCGMSMANYEATLAGFAATTSTGRSLGATGLKYCNTSGRTILTNTVASGGKGWTITGDVQDCATSNFVTRWDLSRPGTSTTALTFGVQVAAAGAATYTWNTVPAGTSGSGTIAANATSVTISGLPASATIEVKINPTNFQRININNGTDKARLVDVSQWGTTAWTSMANAFYGCNNLNITASDVPTLTTVTDMSSMFSGCAVLNSPSNMGTWNTATVTNMSLMFFNAIAFNQNIGTWNTAAVTNMSIMFAGATAFNQNIGTWNTAAVTNMSGMFFGAAAFNQNIGAWNTINVTNMFYMFSDASAFNQNIGMWNTIKVTNMSYMFSGATVFNQNIDMWNTAAVTDMSYMFRNATAFNQNIGMWNTAAVTDMSNMFRNATAFNQNIGTWNTAAVTDMSNMFFGVTAFNQNIGAWNVAAVTDMSYVLFSATAFNQSLAAWGTKFNAAVDLTACLDDCGMSIANYDATLTGFAATTRTGRSLGATGLKYCNTSARTILTNTVASGGKGWTISGDAPVALPSTPTFTAGAVTLCTGATSTYTATAANSSSITYSILNGTGASIDVSTGVVSNITGNFTVVATAANTCNATTTANRAVVINANVTPSVSIAASPSGAITPGTSVTFTATPTNGGATPAYQWKKGNTNVGTNNGAYTEATLANNDIITCQMTSNATCLSSTTATSNTITMIVTVVLPIEFLDIKVQNTEGGKNQLTWRTASEKNNSHFDIERSTDGTTFHNIGQVKGNNKPSSYQFVDNQPFATSYYRLRQIDNDGKETLSKIVSLSNTAKSLLKVYPNPATDVLMVEFTKGISAADKATTFEIINLFGQIILRGPLNQSVDVAALPSGTYIVRLSQLTLSLDGGGLEQVKFVKQ
jgi:surface protein